MRNLKEVFCHLHSHSQPRYPHFTLCPDCREDAPHEAIVVEAVVSHFSRKLPDFFIETELEIQMGTSRCRADIVLFDGEQRRVAIVECKRRGVREDGIAQLQSYLCATDTPLGVFANSTDPDDWEFFENLGQNRFKDITSNHFWQGLQNTSEEEGPQPPVDAYAYYKRGLAKAKRRQHAEAITDYDRAIELKPDAAFAYDHRGKAKYHLGQYAAAISDYDRVIELKPDNAYAYSNRQKAKARLRQHADAINQGQAQYNLGEHAAAIQYYDTAIQIKPDDYIAYYNRGLAKVGLGQYTDAIQDYDNAIQIKPDYANAYYHRGKAKESLRQYADALQDYVTVIQLTPDNALA